MKITLEVEVPKGTTISEIEGAVKRAFDPDWMASWWHIDDVKGQANGWDEEDTEHSITDEEAREILRLADKYHNCEVGINWDVLDNWTDHLKAQRKEVA